MRHEPIYADVAFDSIDHAVSELQELAQAGHTLVVHMTWVNGDYPAASYCSENHEHIVVNLTFRDQRSNGLAEYPSLVLVEAILDDQARPVLLEMQKTIACRMNQRAERNERLATKIDGIKVLVTQWAERSNFNGGYGVGGTEYDLLVN